MSEPRCVRETCDSRVHAAYVTRYDGCCSPDCHALYQCEQELAAKDAEIERLRVAETSWHLQRDGAVAELKRLLRESEEDNVRLRRDVLQRAVEAEEQLATARATNQRLNRRAQMAESAVAEKIGANKVGGFGKQLLRMAYRIVERERNEARAEAHALATENAYMEKLLRRIHDSDALDHARANVLRNRDDMTEAGPDAELFLALLLEVRTLFDDDEASGGDDADS